MHRVLDAWEQGFVRNEKNKPQRFPFKKGDEAMGEEEQGKDASTGELPAAEAVRLDELLEYVSGSVVSRTLIKRPVGTVTLFSFDAGQGLSEHTAPFDAMVQILDGTAEVTIGGEPVKAQSGETVLMPAGVPHSLHAVERFKMLLVMIRG
jgi:quercetin dioxygenase-like cupin family protein